MRPFVVAALGLALLAGPASPMQRVRLDSIVQSTTLENGLQVIVLRNPSVPFVTVEMVFKAGAFTQQDQNHAGLPHLIEHLLFRSGDAGAFDAAAAEIDAISNGVTDTESVRYYLTFPSKHLSQGLSLMADMIRKPKFTQDAIEAEGKVVRGELERRASEPDLLLLTEADALLWGEHAWTSKSAGGNLIAVNAAKPDQLRAMYDRFYVPNNAALIVTGDVTHTDVVALATKVFKGWKRGADPLATVRPPEIKPLKAIARKVFAASVKDVTFFVRWHGPSVGTDPGATYAADVFAGLVNQRVSGTQRRLVDGGIVDDVSLSYETLNHVGPIELMARTSVDRGAEAAKALGEEIVRLTAGDYFDEEDLAFAKKWQRVAAHFQLERAQTAAHIIASYWSTAGLDYYLGYGDALDAQTADDVRRFVSDYIAGRPMAVVVMVPEDGGRTLQTSIQRALNTWRAP